MNDEYISIREAAEIVGISSQRLYQGKSYQKFIENVDGARMIPRTRLKALQEAAEKARKRQGIQIPTDTAEQPLSAPQTAAEGITSPTAAEHSTPCNPLQPLATLELIDTLKAQIEELRQDKQNLQRTIDSLTDANREMRLLLAQEQKQNQQLLAAAPTAPIKPTEAAVDNANKNPTEQPNKAQRPPRQADNTASRKAAHRPPQKPTQQAKPHGLFGLFMTGKKAEKH